MNRVLTRHHKERMRKKAARIYPAVYDDHGNLLFPPQYFLGDNLAVCSCFGCGNQRKYQGKTHAEKINWQPFGTEYSGENGRGRPWKMRR